jgi:hypothetical protein
VFGIVKPRPLQDAIRDNREAQDNCERWRINRSVRSGSARVEQAQRGRQNPGQPEHDPQAITSAWVRRNPSQKTSGYQEKWTSRGNTDSYERNPKQPAGMVHEARVGLGPQVQRAHRRTRDQGGDVQQGHARPIAP